MVTHSHTAASGILSLVVGAASSLVFGVGTSYACVTPVPSTSESWYYWEISS
jgi:hypothetical protein